MLKIGIEQEFVFRDEKENYLDFESTSYSLFKKIVDAFPYFEINDTVFDCKSLEQKPKRCYIEGFERYDTNGQLLETIPKGLEIRTLPHTVTDSIIEDFKNSYTQMINIAASCGLSPLLTSYNPYKTSVVFSQPLSHKEATLRSDERLTVALHSMLSHGLHVNVSMSDLPKEKMTDLIHKINYYAPYIIPFSFSSPFYNGEVFEGFSSRIYFSTGTRNLAELQKRKEINVIEFRGFDACGDAKLLKSLLLLFKGLLLDKSLTKRALSQDTKLLKHSALKGFEDETIKEGALTVLKAALKEEKETLEYLETMLHTNDSYAARIKQAYEKTGDIIKSISNKYRY